MGSWMMVGSNWRRDDTFISSMSSSDESGVREAGDSLLRAEPAEQIAGLVPCPASTPSDK